MDKDFQERNKTVITVFSTISVIFFIIAAFSYRGLFLDVPARFISCFSNVSETSFDVIFWAFNPFNDYNVVLFNLPYCLLEIFFPETPFTKSILYTFCGYFAIFMMLIANFTLSKRTKRFDIAVISLLFYSFLFLPASVWFTNKYHIGIFVFLAFLQYFSSKEKFWKTDYIIIFVLGIILYNSNESLLIPLALISIMSLLYIFINRTNLINKLIIGIISLASVINICTKDFNFILFIENLIKNSQTALLNTFQTCMPISIAGVVLIFYSLFIKRELSKKDSLFFILICTLALYFLGYYTSFEPYPEAEKLFVYYEIILLVPVTLIIIFSDLFKTENKAYCYNNLLIVACIIGILQTMWQINSCRYSFEYGKELSEKIKNSENTVTIVSEKDFSKYALKYYSPYYGYLLRSILLSPDKKVKTILVPDIANFNDELNPIFKNTYYLEQGENSKVVIEDIYIPDNGKYWNFGEVMNIIKSQKQEDNQ